MNRTKSLWVLCAGALLFFAAGCHKLGSRGPETVALVNGEAITRERFDEMVARNVRRHSAQSRELPSAIMARIEEGVLRRMVQDVAIEQRAAKEGIIVSANEIDETFEQHRSRFRDEASFVDYMARANTTPQILKEDLRLSMLRERLVDKLDNSTTPDDAQVRRYYEEHHDQFSDPEQMLVRRLLLPVAADASASERRAIMRRAKALAEQAHRAPEAFAKLCRQHSQGPEASRDGDMGVIAKGRLPELDRLMAQGLREGAVSNVVEGAGALSIYQVTHHRAQRLRPLEEVADGIRTSLALRRRTLHRQEVLQQIESQADVRVLMHFAGDGAPSAPTNRLGSAAASGTAPLSPPDAGEVREPGTQPQAPEPSVP